MKTVNDVQEALNKIKYISLDDEGAHSEEDILWANVLTAIATGTAENPQAMAALALESQKIDFSRWYA